MSWFDTILYPIMVAVAWIMNAIHSGLVALGMGDGPGSAWILSIVGLVILMRILLIPLFFKQIKAMRGMQLMNPDLKKLQAKYKGKTDPASKQMMQQEMMALYKHHGSNPFSSCLPILAQSPIFFALFRVLNSLKPLAEGTYTQDALGPLTQAVASDIEKTALFGANLSETFLTSTTVGAKVVTVVMIVLMSVTTFTTQRQLTMKNMPPSAKEGPMAQQQKMLLYLMPLLFAVSGVMFPIGVLIYWLTTNLWTAGQQFYTIRRHPAPGSEAEKKRRERLRAKGIDVEEEKETGQAARPTGQRNQPIGKKRAKRMGIEAGQAVEQNPEQVKPSGEDEAASEQGDGSFDGEALGFVLEEKVGRDGLTDSQRAILHKKRQAKARKRRNKRKG